MPPVLVLLVSLLGISFAAPLVRLSDAPPLTVAVWRLGFSLVVIAAFLLPNRGWRQWRTLDRREVAIALGAGAMLAFHFWSWNASLNYTTIAASVVLVNLHPAIVALFSVLWLGERPNPRQLLGIALAITGVFVVGAGDLHAEGFGSGARAMVGDLLALIGAVTVAAYYTSGRILRQRLDLWPYVGLVYGACFVVLLALAGLRGDPVLGQPPREMAIFAGLALGPMLLGHTGMNWALKRLPAYLVALTTLGEPVGATLLAWLIPGIAEVPTPATIVGGGVILGGIALTSVRRPGAVGARRDVVAAASTSAHPPTDDR